MDNSKTEELRSKEIKSKDRRMLINFDEINIINYCLLSIVVIYLVYCKYN